MTEGHFPAQLVAGMEQVEVQQCIARCKPMFHSTPPEPVDKLDVIHWVLRLTKLRLAVSP